MAFVATVPDMITSVAFTPDGRYSIVGCLNGLCNLYETDGLKLVGQLHLRSGRARKAKSSKVTDIDTISLPPDDPRGSVKVLVTSNDSRIRMYNLRDRTIEAKFRGNENTCSQIRASFSEDGGHIICGSEDRRTYIWPVDQLDKDLEKRDAEILETQSAMVTAAIMAPTNTKLVLGPSEDPIYDMCNPSPVMLVSQPAPEQNGSHTAPPAPPASESMKLAQKSPAYLSRAKHPDGDIIISADYSGRIKVLRQDCAYHQRRQQQQHYGGSLSRKLLGRSNSSARHSLTSSIGRESSHRTPSERIISWRNSVIRNGGRVSTDSSRRGGAWTRNTSPRASPYSSPGRVSLAVGADHRSAFAADNSSADSTRSSGDEAGNNNGGQRMIPRILHPPVGDGRDKVAGVPWTPDDHGYVYWNKLAHDALAASSKKPPNRHDNNLLDPLSGIVTRTSMERQTSASTLSSDNHSVQSTGETDRDVLTCDNCHGMNFQAAKGRDGKQRLVCIRCRRPIT